MARPESITVARGQWPSIRPDRRQFRELARKAHLVPVVRELIADCDTPVSALAKLGDSPHAFLLESVEGGENLGRYSFVGNSALCVFESRGDGVVVTAADGAEERVKCDNPLVALRELLQRYRPAHVTGLPRFFGGAVGYLSYDAVRAFERLPDTNKDDLDLPETYLMVTDTVLIFDHARRKLFVVANTPVAGDPDAAYDEAIAKIDRVVERLRGPAGIHTIEGLRSPAEPVAFDSNMTKPTFMKAVRRAKAYIRAGDIFQVALSQRLTARVQSDPFDVYRVLRAVNPSPYMFYLKFGDLAITGSSPEVMVRAEGGQALVRPIAGTRPRGSSDDEDVRLEQELLADEKERAEHIMLVDLGRNDLGRVCTPGTVSVDELMTIERYSHVMHIVSNVTGTLEADRDAFDLFCATFPAGTISGAPKIRAMEIIDELEPTRRGPYSGAVGYFGFSGNMDTCITIRTVVMRAGRAYVQVGAGIVADSDPAREYEETLNKARGMLAAIQMAEESSLSAADPSAGVV